MTGDYTQLPADLPVPVDDGAAEGIVGREMPEELGLPTFAVEDRVLYRRLTFVAAEGRIVKVFYPVFPPDRDAAEVPAWLRERVAEAEAA